MTVNIKFDKDISARSFKLQFCSKFFQYQRDEHDSLRLYSHSLKSKQLLVAMK